MHIAGGALIILGLLALQALFRWPRRLRVWQLVVGLLLIIITWELFEWHVGLYSPETYVFDVSKDLFFGLLGGLVGYLFVRRFTIETL